MSNFFTSPISRLVLAGFVAAALSGCADQPKPEGHDFRQNHKVQVTNEQVSISIALPQSGTELSPADASRFKRFLRDYVQRGRTAVTVETVQPTVARDVLLSLGLRDNEIFLAPAATVKAPNALLSFTANKAISPECGDWSSSPSLIWDNKPHSNFGCSIQRNTSKMVADPGDFIQAKPTAGGSASRTDADIFTHQSGAPKTRLLDGSGAAITGQ
ncbi:CpaD family pilus assembly lipoprotein [Magnetovibrio sp.]|uniref:CpaD family pilus assembly lipoprotein n=1 Tax=Magnetovibrio sp. TaxID=2024836 RepID=UPI002F9229D7